jgi:2-C-methyl-D-erythritol 2,4-cyclodiphosphate synthase
MVRMGIGYDVHQLVSGRKLILGGVEIPSEIGLLGHSDADVLIHAICDALLGAAALGDIGQHFPDTDPRYAGVSSMVLLEATHSLLIAQGYRIINVDSSLILEEPKIAKFVPQMCGKISEALKIPVNRVSIKATTHEKLGAFGRMEGAAALAVAALEGAD